MRVHLVPDMPAGGAVMLALGILAGCGGNETPDDALKAIKAPEVARIVPATEALAGAHIPTVDPVTMHEAEIGKALESGPRCDFRYTTRGKQVLAFSLHQNGEANTGVVKLNGHLVMLRGGPRSTAAEGNGEFLLRADPIQMAVIPDAEEQVIERSNVRRKEANALFEVGARLRVGYRGYLDCTAKPQAISPRQTSGR